MGLKLVITVDDRGICNVEGPLQNKVLCYGLLEEAKNVVREFQQPLIAPAAVIPNLRPNGKG